MLLAGPLPTSALQRSKTAPTPLVDAPTARRDGGPRMINTSVASGLMMKAKPTTSFHAKAGLNVKTRDGGSSGPGEQGVDFVLPVDGRSARTLVSPRHDNRDNPFNLAGFFPSRPGSPDHPVEWARRSPVELSVPQAGEEGGEMDRGRDSATEWSKMVSARSLSMNALDEYAREVIARESQLGILGIAKMPSFFKSIRNSYFGTVEEGEQHGYIQSEHLMPSEEEDYISTTMDEPFDAETLCESMHSRRVAAEREATDSGGERVHSLGLFSPGTALETEEVELGWATTLYSKLLGPEV